MAERPRAAVREGGLSPAEQVLSDRRGPEWVAAPSGSHVHSFAFDDARKNSFLRKFGPHDGASQLSVRFKPSAGSGRVTQYTYYFRDHAEGGRVFGLLRAAAHPGELVHAELIAPGIPVDRVA